MRKRRTLNLYYRRRRRGRRLGVTAATACVLGLAIAAGVLAATHGSSRTQPDARRNPYVVRAVGRPVAAHRSPRGGSSAELRALRAVLRYTPFIAEGVPRHRMIALTFDDGPSPYTPQIVRLLVRMHVPATFFIVGQQLNDFSAAAREERAHGFVIGDHTENHAWLIRLSEAGQYAQIHDDGERLKHLGVAFPHLFRPPYGQYNRTTLSILHRLGMLMVMWSIDPGDWRRPGVKAIVSNVLAHAKPGAIVIMHDGGGDRSQTLAALPAIINGLRRRHFELVTVPQLLASDPPPRHQTVPTAGAA